MRRSGIGVGVDKRTLAVVALTLDTLARGERDALDVQVVALGTRHHGGVDVELGHRQQVVSGWIIVAEVGEDVARLLPIGFLVIHLAGSGTPTVILRRRRSGANAKGVTKEGN